MKEQVSAKDKEIERLLAKIKEKEHAEELLKICEVDKMRAIENSEHFRQKYEEMYKKIEELKNRIAWNEDELKNELESLKEDKLELERVKEALTVENKQQVGTIDELKCKIGELLQDKRSAVMVEDANYNSRNNKSHETLPNKICEDRLTRRNENFQLKPCLSSRRTAWKY